MTLSIEAGPALRQTDYVNDPSAATWSVATSLDWDWTISPTMKLSQDASSYVYCSEIFPTGVRAHGLGTSIAGLFGSTLLYTQVAPTAFATIGWK